MSNNKALIDRILQKTDTVVVLGSTLTLTMPTTEQLAELRSAQVNAAQNADGDDNINELSSYLTKCVAFTCGWNEDEASSVLFASGKEADTLIKAVTSFLGMGDLEDDGTVDDPS